MSQIMKRNYCGAAWILVVSVAVLSLKARAEETAAADENRIATLIRQLGAEKYEDREIADKELRQIGFPAFKKLRAAQDLGDAEIRSRADSIIGNYDAIMALLKGFPQDWHTTLYYNGLTETQSRLSGFGDTVVPYLADRLKYENNLFRFNCVTVLDAIRTPAALECLRKLATDAYPWCRVEAVWALGNARDAASLPILINALDDKDQTVQKEALLAVGKVAGLKIYGVTPTRWFEYTAVLYLPKEVHEELSRIGHYYLDNKEMPEAETLSPPWAKGHGAMVLKVKVGGDQMGGDQAMNLLGEELIKDWKIKLFKDKDSKEYWLVVHLTEEPEFLKNRPQIEPVPVPPPPPPAPLSQDDF